MKIKEAYNELREKYDLPSFEEMDEEFEISGIEVDKVNSLARGVLRVMCNKIVIFLNYVEPVVSPNPNGLHAFVEVENTTNEEKKEVFTFYKNLSYKYHKAYGLELVENEKKVVEEIKNILKDWKSIRLNFKKLIAIINNSWKREKEKDKVENVG